jgi:hypothetical protein
MKILKFFRDQIIYLLGDIVLFLLAFLFIYKGYNPKNTDQRNAVYLAIGTSLIAAGIVALLELWKDLSRNKMLERINNVILDGGINFVFPKRDLDKYDLLMKNFNNKLDIVGYSLNAFYESYADLLVEKTQETPSMIVRMLLVNPESDASKHRAEMEGKSSKSVEDSVNRLKQKFNDAKNIEIRQINSPLTTMIFRIDETMFVGPHFYKKPSKSTLTLELDKDGWLYQEYEKEFEKLWQDASDLRG